MTYTCTPTASPTTITCSVTIPANLANMTASQPATITVSTTTSGLTSAATSNAISIAPVVYTYGISLTSTSSSLTYGYTSTIVPIVTCKTSTGVACASGVYNPQLANFSIINGPGSLSSTSNAASTTYTDTALIGYRRSMLQYRDARRHRPVLALRRISAFKRRRFRLILRRFPLRWQEERSRVSAQTSRIRARPQDLPGRYQLLRPAPRQER